MPYTDITGMTFGRLRAIARSDKKSRVPYWACVCECGTVKDCRHDALTRGAVKSCGCLKSKKLAGIGYSKELHGYRSHPLYERWRKMMARCYDPSQQGYHRYGGRGISVCAEWQSVSAFVEWGLSSGFDPSLTLERINNDGDYEPANCRWATQKEQASNRSTNVYIEIGGENKTISEWSRETGVRTSKISYRVSKGFSPQDCLSKETLPNTGRFKPGVRN